MLSINFHSSILLEWVWILLLLLLLMWLIELYKTLRWRLCLLLCKHPPITWRLFRVTFLLLIHWWLNILIPISIKVTCCHGLIRRLLDWGFELLRPIPHYNLCWNSIVFLSYKSRSIHTLLLSSCLGSGTHLLELGDVYLLFLVYLLLLFEGSWFGIVGNLRLLSKELGGWFGCRNCIWNISTVEVFPLFHNSSLDCIIKNLEDWICSIWIKFFPLDKSSTSILSRFRVRSCQALLNELLKHTDLFLKSLFIRIDFQHNMQHMCKLSMYPSVFTYLHLFTKPLRQPTDIKINVKDWFTLVNKCCK